jgi:hypothetical protein
MERMSLKQLTVGQHGLRYAVEHMHRMMDFVADGGVWNEGSLRQYAGVEQSLIQLSMFPPEPGGSPLLLIHDGHHRLVATLLAGRDFLHPDEFEVTQWTYADYLSINLSLEWVTPFDPRSQARLADFGAWKLHVLAIARDDPAGAERLIREQPGAYREARRYSGLASLSCDCCSLELDRWRQKREARTRRSK